MSVSDGGATVVVSPQEEHEVITDTLVRYGATPADARLQAETLVEADLRGHASHGIRRLPILAGRLRGGLATSGLEPACRWLSDSALVVDGHRGLGPVVIHRTLDLLLERVTRTGVAIASIRNSGHIGMLAPYVERVARAGCAGIALTVSEALVHPWNGRTAMVGTNPIGIGIPTLGDPFILDMSTAEVSMGRILDHAERGEAIPIGWALDHDGGPTTDAAAAAEGAISPFGGPKGYALGLAFEALVGLLAGTAFGRDVRGTLDTEHPSTKGDLLVVFSLDVFGATDHLGYLTAYFDAIRRTGGSSAVTVPGDRARKERAARSLSGIPLDAAIWADALALRDGVRS